MVTGQSIFGFHLWIGYLYIKLANGQVRQIALGDLYIERWSSDCKSLIVRDQNNTLSYLSTQ